MQPERPSFTSSTCEIHRNVGPKGVHGCVTLSFYRANEFNLSSEANWPEGDDYSAAIQEAIQSTIAELKLPFEVACTIKSIRWHPIDSCENGFTAAARHATRAALAHFVSP
jgi:hypothetical protein